MKYDMQTVDEMTEIMREYLLFDCYLRENMKTAPAFAKDNSEYKVWLREFYQKEEEERKYLSAYEQYDSKQMAKMTHVEFFKYAVWKKDCTNIKEILDSKTEQTQPILFDYKERSVITKDCRFVLLPKAED